MQEKIISVKKLVKSFNTGVNKQTIINKLDLDIYKNDFTIIMGSSGAGKSTLMYCLSGMDKATSGSIKFGDEDICKMSNDQLAVFRRKNCGFVFQQIYLLDKMSLMDNVLVLDYLQIIIKKKLLKKPKSYLKR